MVFPLIVGRIQSKHCTSGPLPLKTIPMKPFDERKEQFQQFEPPKRLKFFPEVIPMTGNGSVQHSVDEFSVIDLIMICHCRKSETEFIAETEFDVRKVFRLKESRKILQS